MEPSPITEVAALRKQVAALRERLAGLEAYGAGEPGKHPSLVFTPESDRMLNSVPAMICLIDTDGRFRRVNRRYESFYGKETGWLIGRHISEVTGEEHGLRAAPFIERALSGEQVIFESSVTDGQGEKRDVRVVYIPQFDSSGLVEGFVALVEDISEQKRAQDSLRESERRFRTLAETVPQLVWTSGADGCFDYVSSQWVEYAGVPEEQLLNFGWIQVMHPDDRDRILRAWLEAVAERAPYDVEFRQRRHDGEYRWFKTRGAALRSDQGTVLKWFGTCTDIHQEKTRDQERQKLLVEEQKARAGAELLNRISPLLISELDPRKLVQRITDITTELIHAEFGSFVHKGFTESPGELYDFYTARGSGHTGFEDVPMLRGRALLAEILEQGNVVLCEDVLEDAHYGPFYEDLPGVDSPVRSYLAVPVMSRSGRADGGLLFGHSKPRRFSKQDADLLTGIAAQAAVALDNARLFAETEQAKQTLQKTNQELQVAVTDLEQFASAAAHDLQEPLRMVTSYTQLLQRSLNGQLDSTTEEFMSFVVGGVKRMSLLLQDLLIYSESSRESEAIPSEVELQGVVEQSLNNLRPAIDESGASIEISPLPVVFGREFQFVQVFQNLLSNAIKYCKAGEPPRIRILASEMKDDWLVRVEDDGLGIDEQYHKQIFGVFKRLHGRDIPGTGIGLAICQRIVERAGGQIWVASEPGVGSSFCLTLPKASARAD